MKNLIVAFALILSSGVMAQMKYECKYSFYSYGAQTVENKPMILTVSYKNDVLKLTEREIGYSAREYTYESAWDGSEFIQVEGASNEVIFIQTYGESSLMGDGYKKIVVTKDKITIYSFGPGLDNAEEMEEVSRKEYVGFNLGEIFF